MDTNEHEGDFNRKERRDRKEEGSGRERLPPFFGVLRIDLYGFRLGSLSYHSSSVMSVVAALFLCTLFAGD